MGSVASISDKVTDLGEYLREQREAARLSVRQLARLTGVSNPYLSQIERGLRNPSAEVLQQIAKGLRISAEVLYVRAGILDGEGRPDVQAAIGADAALTERQRRALLDIYASFLAENSAQVPRTASRSRVAAARSAVGAGPGAAARTARVSSPRRTTKAATTKAATKKAAAKKAATTRAAAKAATKKAATSVSATVPRRRRRDAAHDDGTEADVT
jgi:transcriptional regulator with XRE-family HTH domain